MEAKFETINGLQTLVIIPRNDTEKVLIDEFMQKERITWPVEALNEIKIKYKVKIRVIQYLNYHTSRSGNSNHWKNTKNST